MEFTDIIAPVFYDALRDIESGKYTHFWFKGGRGSSKSSFISLVIILNLMRFPGRNAVVFRKIDSTLRNSVFAQLLWAIDKLGVREYWQPYVSPLSLIYKPTENHILFRGVDDPSKIKSLKSPKGYYGYVWFEELAEFSCMNEVRSILQTTLRDGDDFSCFYSYNPPKSIHSWINAECAIPREDKKVYHSTYLDLPKGWVTEPFLMDAETLKKTDYDKYKHELLGIPTGTGGEVFRNVRSLTMTDEMIQEFDNIKAGLDWGWSIDPLAYVEYHKDSRKKALYIYHEYYGLGISNEKIARHILSRNLPRNVIVKADSAEGKSIVDVRNYGVNITPCKKGRDSVARTMRHLVDEIQYIYIDPVRCPNTYREFTRYELLQTADGYFRSDYPDKDNHTIDAVRYGEDEINVVTVKAGRSNIY